MNDEKPFILIAALTTVALVLAIVMAWANINQLKESGQNYTADFSTNPYK